jgi:hypothetical protein
MPLFGVEGKSSKKLAEAGGKLVEGLYSSQMLDSQGENKIKLN